MALTIYPSGLSGNVTIPSPGVLTNGDALSSAAQPGGVIQTVWKRYDSLTTWSAPVNSNTPVWDLDIEITPKRANSNLIIRYCISYEMHHDTVFRLARGENMMRTLNPGREQSGGYTPDWSSYNRWIGTWNVGYDVNTDSTPFTRTFMFVDPSENTLTKTYRLYVSASGGTAYTLFMNRATGTIGDNYEVGVTSVMVQEVA